MVRQSLEEAISPHLSKLGWDVHCSRSLEQARLDALANCLIVDEIHPRTLRKIRETNPNLKIGLADPKLDSGRSSRHLASLDFALVSSPEQRSAVSSLPIRTEIMYWVPNLEDSDFESLKRPGPTRVAYHGNKVHLFRLEEVALQALNDLSATHDLVLELHYNIARYGKWRPKKDACFSIRHRQWSGEDTWRELATADIGLMPNVLSSGRSIVPQQTSVLASRMGLNRENRRPNDIRLRFKATSNFGRAYPYAHFGIPIIADIYPSSAQHINHGKNGLLAFDALSWKESLHLLFSQPQYRQELGTNLRQTVTVDLSPKASAKRLAQLLHSISQS